MSDDDSIVCVDQHGNPIAESSEKWPLALSLGRHAVYEIDDSDSSIDTAQRIGMAGREEGGLVDKDEEEEEEEGNNDGAESPVSLSAKDPDRRIEGISPHNIDKKSDRSVGKRHNGLASFALKRKRGRPKKHKPDGSLDDTTTTSATTSRHLKTAAPKRKRGRPRKHGSLDKTTKITTAAQVFTVLASLSRNKTITNGISAAKTQLSGKNFDEGSVMLEKSGNKNLEKNDDASRDGTNDTSSPKKSDGFDGTMHNNSTSLDDKHKGGHPIKHKADETTKVASLPIRSRVYAKWSNGHYFWGTITAVSGNCYSILFDDGDYLHQVPKKHLETAAYMKTVLDQAPPPLKKDLAKRIKELISCSASTMTLEEMLKNKCGKCLNCRKEDCGQCASCVSCSDTEVCIQKMCCELSEQQKAQPMPPCAKFPDGWRYLVDPTMKWLGKQGLKILPPNGGHPYYSVENAQAQLMLEGVSPSDFYEYIGIIPKAASTSNIMERIISAPERAVVGRKGICESCENCRKEPCGRCTWCRSDEDRCFQKMCFEMPVDAKAEPAVGFPPDWRFYFAKKRRLSNGPYKYIPCLWILSPGGKSFRSVEAAIGGCKLEDGKMIAHEFYEHIGLPHEGKRSLSDCRNVGSRNCCTVGEKRLCGAVVEKSGQRRNTFSYSVWNEADGTLIDDVDEKYIFNEMKYRKKFGNDPPPPPVRHESDCVSDEEKSVESRPRKKQRVKQSSTSQIRASTNHLLVGRDFCFKWIDLNRQSKVVYGKVTECEQNMRNGDINSFKVTYNDKARELLNKIGTGCGSKVREFQVFDPLWAWGGCILAKQERQDSRERSWLGRHLPPIYWSWLTPTMSIHSMVDSGGTRRPRLMIFHRCCQLQFDVKPSRIPNAGNGVFLSCTRLDGETGSFKLKAGELLDLGIYAPLRVRDWKLEAVFFVKNFIHNFKVEEFAFSAGDTRYHLDVSDDDSGDLHAAAKSQIFPFVNETFDDKSITVQCAFDPEGGLHYLLGHSSQGQGDFAVPADGSEIELHISYGPVYEKVRIRKGYSKLSQEHQEGVLELQDAGYLESMDEFEDSDVKACVDFLSMLFLTKSEFAPELIQRALMCSVVLQRRARHLALDNSTEGEVSMTKVSKNAHDLISLLLKNDELEELHSAGNCEEVLKRVFARHQFSCEALGELAFMWE